MLLYTIHHTCHTRRTPSTTPVLHRPSHLGYTALCRTWHCTLATQCIALMLHNASHLCCIHVPQHHHFCAASSTAPVLHSIHVILQHSPHRCSSMHHTLHQRITTVSPEASHYKYHEGSSCSCCCTAAAVAPCCDSYSVRYTELPKKTRRHLDLAL